MAVFTVHGHTEAGMILIIVMRGVILITEDTDTMAAITGDTGTDIMAEDTMEVATAMVGMEKTVISEDKILPGITADNPTL